MYKLKTIKESCHLHGGGGGGDDDLKGETKAKLATSTPVVKKIKNVYTRESYTIILTESNELFASGDNTRDNIFGFSKDVLGKLTKNHILDHFEPIFLGRTGKIIDVVCYADALLIHLDDNSLWFSGVNREDRFSKYFETNSGDEFKKIKLVKNTVIKKLYTNNQTTVILTDKNELWGVGGNTNNKLGLLSAFDNRVNEFTKIPLDIKSPIKDVFINDDTVLIHTSDDELWKVSMSNKFERLILDSKGKIKKVLMLTYHQLILTDIGELLVRGKTYSNELGILARGQEQKDFKNISDAYTLHKKVIVDVFASDTTTVLLASDNILLIYGKIGFIFHPEPRTPYGYFFPVKFNLAENFKIKDVIITTRFIFIILDDNRIFVAEISTAKEEGEPENDKHTKCIVGLGNDTNPIYNFKLIPLEDKSGVKKIISIKDLTLILTENKLWGAGRPNHGEFGKLINICTFTKILETVGVGVDYKKYLTRAHEDIKLLSQADKSTVADLAMICKKYGIRTVSSNNKTVLDLTIKNALIEAKALDKIDSVSCSQLGPFAFMYDDTSSITSSNTAILFVMLDGKQVVLKVTCGSKDSSRYKPILYETKLYQYISSFMLMFTPNILKSYGSIRCKKLQIDKFFGPKLPAKYKKKLEEIGCSNSDNNSDEFLINVLEYASLGDLYKVIQKDWQLFKLYIKNIMFMVLYTLRCFNKFGLRHNDLHMGNILLFNIGSEVLYKFTIDETDYYIRTKYIPLLFDYDRASKFSQPALTNTSLDQLDFCRTYGQCNSENYVTDVVSFLCEMNRTTYLERILGTEITTLIKRIKKDELDTLSKIAPKIATAYADSMCHMNPKYGVDNINSMSEYERSTLANVIHRFTEYLDKPKDSDDAVEYKLPTDEEARIINEYVLQQSEQIGGYKRYKLVRI